MCANDRAIHKLFMLSVVVLACAGGVAEGQCTLLASSPEALQVLGQFGAQRVLTGNRYLTFSAGDPGRSQAIRVTFDDLSPPFDIWNGAQLWAGPPNEYSENGSSLAPIPGFGTFFASALQCTPFFAEWSQFGALRVFHEGIVPDGSFSVEVIDEECISTSKFSDSLIIATALNGDILETCQDHEGCAGGTFWPAPDGRVVILDILASINSFVGAPEAPFKSNADLEPPCVDLVIQISDILGSVQGFMGLRYQHEPSVADPCDSPCLTPMP